MQLSLSWDHVASNAHFKSLGLVVLMASRLKSHQTVPCFSVDRRVIHPPAHISARVDHI